jgi:hypothetical protein
MQAFWALFKMCVSVMHLSVSNIHLSSHTENTYRSSSSRVLLVLALCGLAIARHRTGVSWLFSFHRCVVDWYCTSNFSMWSMIAHVEGARFLICFWPCLGDRYILYACISPLSCFGESPWFHGSFCPARGTNVSCQFQIATSCSCHSNLAVARHMDGFSFLRLFVYMLSSGFCCTLSLS